MDLHRRSDFHVIADSSADKEHWLESRERILTSSDVFTFRGVGIPGWWSSTRDDIMKGKTLGISQSFPTQDAVSIAHGSFDEQNIAAKFGKGLGCHTQCVNWLVVHDRWENLGASIDGFTAVDPDAIAEYEFFQDKPSAEYLRAQLEDFSVPLLLEIKKSTSRKWQKAPPEYYADAQVQMQLHILDLPAAVLCAETVKDVRHVDAATKRPYYRRYWDLKPYLVHRQPEWADILDEVNNDFEAEWEKWL